MEKIASGSKRDVYLFPQAHPDQAKPLLLKLPRYTAHKASQPFLKRILYSLFPKTMERGIVQEAKYRETLEKLPAEVGSIPIPAFLGFVETTEGRGSLWEAVLDETGNLAPTVSELVERGDTAGLVEALNRFVKSCYQFNIVAADVHNSNLVLAHGGNGLEIKLIDGFGDHRLISLRAIFRWKNRKTLEKRFGKMAKAAGLAFDAKNDEFSPSPQSDLGQKRRD